MTKLPKLFTNNFNKKIDNSMEYVKVSNNEVIDNKQSNDIRKKIDNVFKSKNYIYKINVLMNINGIENKYTIIGKTKNKLITINNEIINIDDILDIKKVD